MVYKIEKKNHELTGEIQLSTSKSISNRLLIIQALCDSPFTIHRLSDSDDTRILIKALQSNDKLVNIGPAGTSMRFLTAYFAGNTGKKPPYRILTGSERMKNRPIAILVEALNQLGASISYHERKGFPPLKIESRKLTGNQLAIDGSVSSQYITALLLIAPRLEQGLRLKLENKITSRAYIQLTLQLMQYFGIQYEWQGKTIYIPHQSYKNKDITVEADWSSASYWYSAAALCNTVDLTLKGLTENSLQGDSALATLYEPLGVHTTFGQNYIHLSKTSTRPKNFSFDFQNNPDIAQTMAVSLVMLNIPFHFKGLETLRIKETDRILALQNELKKLGAKLTIPNDGQLQWDGKRDSQLAHAIPEIKTYKDHRMAMAFAPAAIHLPLQIDDPLVVSKSYPKFWDDLCKMGFKIDKY